MTTAILLAVAIAALITLCVLDCFGIFDRPRRTTSLRRVAAAGPTSDRPSIRLVGPTPIDWKKEGWA